MDRYDLIKILSSRRGQKARWPCVNLSGMDLSGMDLRGVDLSWVDFVGANLSKADFTQSNLCRSNFLGANLNKANLTDANIFRANFTRANLRKATMPQGISFERYLAETVPALLTAGGKTLSEIATYKHWSCHNWSNCPIAAAFGVENFEDVPPLFLTEARLFIQLFDQGLIPMPDTDGAK